MNFVDYTHMCNTWKEHLQFNNTDYHVYSYEDMKIRSCLLEIVKINFDKIQKYRDKYVLEYIFSSESNARFINI